MQQRNCSKARLQDCSQSGWVGGVGGWGLGGVGAGSVPWLSFSSCCTNVQLVLSLSANQVAGTLHLQRRGWGEGSPARAVEMG